MRGADVRGPRHLRRRAAALPLATAVLLATAATMGAAAPVGPADRGPGATSFPDEAPPDPRRYRGSETGCLLDDPTGGAGCVTGATAWLLAEVEHGFGPLPTGCWDEHAWNPSSDHPLGRACDYTFGTLGEFPDDDDVEDGWLLASWLRDNAERLGVRYVIWQGRIWVHGDEEWEEYTGGGVYDPENPTGGHFDHVHVSTRS